MTIREATYRWINGFSRIPYGICEKLLKISYEELHEITPPSVNDRINIWNGEYDGYEGVIIDRKETEDGETVYIVSLDGGEEEAKVIEDEFEVVRDDYLPIWGTLWAFGCQFDNYWLENSGGLQAMADCGFRIYEQENYGYIFGIDGAGYDFYEAHWIPLYKARGLQWHDQDNV